MHISEMLTYYPRTAARTGSIARRARFRALIAATLFTMGISATAHADIIELTRTVDAKEKLPMELTGKVTSFSFDVPVPPVPGPILKHGLQHFYFDTKVLITFIVSTQLTLTTPETPQDLGFMTKPVTVNQSFDTDELLKALSPATGVKQVYISVVDYYSPDAVPEPAQWLLMIGGFAAVGGMMRRRKLAPA